MVQQRHHNSFIKEYISKENAMNTKILKAFFASLAISVCSFANAALITSNTLNSPLEIDFSDQADQSNVIGPVQIGDLVGLNVTVESSSNSNGLYFNWNGWGMVDNGNWGSGRTYVSLNGSDDSMLFSFNDGPISGVGGLVSYARFNDINNSQALDLIFSVYDNSMNLLETVNITSLADIVEPNFNGSAFRGIQRNSADISYFEISGGLANAIDNLTFELDPQAMPVTEPSTLAILMLGMFGLASRRFRSKK